jgi:hypothetical protein
LEHWVRGFEFLSGPNYILILLLFICREAGDSSFCQISVRFRMSELCLDLEQGRGRDSSVEGFEPGTTRIKPNAVPRGMTCRNISLI